MYYFEISDGIDTRECRVRFQYEHLDEPAIHQRVVGKESKYKHKTIAIIETKSPLDGKWSAMIKGEAWCSTQDQFEKKTGRKYALRRLSEGLDKPFKAAMFGAVFKHEVRNTGQSLSA